MRIVSRSEWGAAPPRGRTLVNWPAGVDLWLHHSAGPPTQTPREIQAFHMNVRGWSDIGYSYLIDFAGTIYEGRGRDVWGAHSPGKNHEPSVSLIGTYASVEPSDAQHRAVYELKKFLSAGRLRGHRENTATTCPGDAAYAKIVKGPPPADADDVRFYYFEELPHTEGGTGPKIVGQVKGYSKPALAWAVAKAQSLLGRSVSILKGDDDRHYVLWWAPGTHGELFRFGPWRDKEARDGVLDLREENTGRTMRRFEGRSRSLYPYPKEN